MALESIPAWADRHGVTHHDAHRLVALGEILTVKLGKRRMVITDDGQVPPPTPCPGLRLLCLLVPGRNGQARALPVHTLRPMPPRVCPTRAHLKNGPRRWCLETAPVGMVDHPGLYLRETHAKRPTAEVLERCSGQWQTRALRPALGSVRAGGLSHV